MFFRKKKPKRLYYPAKSKWYTRPRRRRLSVKRPNRLLKNSFGGINKIIKKLPYLIAVAIGFFLLIISLIFSSYFSIKNIQVVRENLNIDSAAIENKLNQYIGKNIVFFPRSKIYTTIQKDFPEFASVKVNKSLPSTIKIQLKSHTIVANLKAYHLPAKKTDSKESTESTEFNNAVKDLLNPKSTEGLSQPINPIGSEKTISGIFDLDATKKKDEPKPIEQKSLLNSVGQAIFDREESLEFITITIRGLTAPIKDREQMIERTHMSYVLNAIKYFKDVMKSEIVGAEYLKVAREIHLKTKKNLVIWISIERDFKTQIDKLQTIYEAAELNKENLSYIDLRVRNKLIYCQANARCSTLSQ